MRRHPGHCLLHVELEAHASLQRLRQAGHDARQFDVRAFERRRQFIVQTQLRKGRRPDEAECRPRGGEQYRCDKSPYRRRRLPQTQQQQGTGTQAAEPRERRQRRLLLQQPYTSSECQNE